MTPRVVVFDLGNVLVQWDRRLLYEQLIPEPEQLDWFLDNVLTLQENAVLDRGVPLADMTADLARRHPDHRDLIDAFRTRWVETIGDVVHGSVDLLHALVDRGVPCYALSNWGADTFELVADRWAWMDLFEGLVISGREGVAKPDRAIFDLLCQRYDFPPTEALFIDDSPANIAAAGEIGFATVLFANPPQLHQQLQRYGLL